MPAPPSPCSLAPGPSSYRGQSVLAVAIKDVALPVEGDYVALPIEDAGGRAVGTLLAGPPPL